MNEDLHHSLGYNTDKLGSKKGTKGSVIIVQQYYCKNFLLK